MERKNHPPTPCCHYSGSMEFPYPVYWNSGNSCIQCHACGTVYTPQLKRNTNTTPVKGIPRTIRIVPVLNGYLVDVGCQRIAFDNPTVLMLDLHEYLLDPQGFEKQFVAKALHRDMINTFVPPQRDDQAEDRIHVALTPGLPSTYPPPPSTLGTCDCEPKCPEPCPPPVR